MAPAGAGPARVRAARRFGAGVARSFATVVLAAAAVGVFLVSAVGCAPETPGPPSASAIRPVPGYGNMAARLGRFVAAEMEAKRIPAFAVAVTHGDRVVWAEGFGEARPGVPTDVDTLFRVGSVSKLFTDIAVMRLVEAGRLDLDADVRDALPSFAPGAEGADPPAITLRQLMAHRSGLVREPPVGNYFDDSRPSLAETVDSLNGVPLTFLPGERLKYSNAGIAVVGRVLEATGGRPFAETVAADVLGPLGIHDASFDLAEADAGRVADATMWSYDGREFPAPDFPLGMAPAGSMTSSARGLARFLTVLASGELPGVLSSAGLSEMFRVQYPDGTEDEGATGFGLGFHVGRLETPDRGGGTAMRRIVRHGGAIYGFSTELALLPESGLGAVAVSNVDFTNAVTARVVRHALLNALRACGAPCDSPDEEADYEVPRTEPLAPGLARRLAGRYESESGDRIRILARGDRAELEIGSITTELRWSPGAESLLVDSRLAFFPKIVIAEETAGRVDALAAPERRWRRIPDPPPEPPPAEWAGYFGEYGPDHNILFVFERDGRLAVLVEWLERYPLSPSEAGADVFDFPAGGLYPGESLRFERDGDGRVVGASLSGIPFPKREGPGEGTFRIEPLRPVAELREIAANASPPEESGDFLPSDLARLTDLDPTIRLDVRYAGTNNFMGAAFYEVADAFLQRPAAEALVRVHRALGERGYGLIVHDGYRPWRVTKMFYDATPVEQRMFVADPASGSRHNRGAAVDLGMYHRESGETVRFVSGYDEFSERAFPGYPGGTSRQRYFRELLREEMEKEGFSVYEFEWWHFDHRDWERHRIQNVALRDLP